MIDIAGIGMARDTKSVILAEACEISSNAKASEHFQYCESTFQLRTVLLGHGCSESHDAGSQVNVERHAYMLASIDSSWAQVLLALSHDIQPSKRFHRRTMCFPSREAHARLLQILAERSSPNGLARNTFPAEPNGTSNVNANRMDKTTLICKQCRAAIPTDEICKIVQ